MVMVHMREVGIYKTILLNLVNIRIQSLMYGIVVKRLLILHSFILTLIALVIFFELVIIMRLFVFDWKAIILTLFS